MRTNITNTQNLSKTRLMQIAFIAGIFITVIISVTLILDSQSVVSGYDDLKSEIEIQEEVGGVSTSCDTTIDNISLIESFSGGRTWILLGPEFSKDDNTLFISLYLNPGYEGNFDLENINVEYQVDQENIHGEMEKITNYKYSAQLEAKDYEPGSYSVKAVINHECGTVTSEPYQFNVSYPLYVTWTQDWEGTEIEDQYLDDMEKISADHGIPMTHFFNPRIYVTSAVSPERAQYFTDWVLRRENDYGDDIGLHLHMYPDMVRAAGVTPISQPTRWDPNRDDGYDILTSDYSERDMIKIMTWSKELFIAKGLGDPEMYRAGGWFADEETLSAAQKVGFQLDSSGRTSYTLGGYNVEGPWSLNSTTKPYQLNSTDQNNTTNSNMDLWEFPNNGGDSWAFSDQEMIGRFTDNYKGVPLSEKQVVTYISHPHWFYEDKPKLEVLFTEIDKNLYESDNGPVIYTTLGESHRVWSLSDATN